MLGGVRQLNQQVRRWPPSASQYSLVSHRFKSHQIPSSSNHFTFGHFAPASRRLHRAASVPLHQILRPLYRGSKSLPTKRIKETTQWQPCPLPAFVLCTAVTPRRAKSSITSPRTRSVIPSRILGNPNHRNLASTIRRRALRAALRREMAKAGPYPESPFRATSQLPLQETTPCRSLY